MSDNNNKKEEEVEIGSLFILLGNAVETLFIKINVFFKTFFHYVITSILFLKKNILVISIATIMGGLLGYLLTVKNEKKYFSEMVLDTNHKIGIELYKQTEFLNKLIKSEDLNNLSKILNISETDVKTINSIIAAPYYPEQNIVKEYDDYIQNTDTIYTKNFTIEDFRKRYNNQDFRLQKITISGTNKELFVNLNNRIIELVNNDYYKNFLNFKTKEFEKRKEILQKNLSYIDSLRKTYKKIDLLIAKKNNTVATNNINLIDNPDTKNRDIELFRQSNYLLSELQLLNKEILKEGYVIKPISKFNIGQVSNKVMDKLWFRYAVYGLILSLLFLLVTRFNRYLNNYNSLIKKE